MAFINKRPRAQEDLIEIWLFIAKENIFAADKYLDEIEAKIIFLSHNPLASEGYKARGYKTKGIRKCPVNKHIIFYLPLKDGIEIIRVLHGAMDIDKIL